MSVDQASMYAEDKVRLCGRHISSKSLATHLTIWDYGFLPLFIFLRLNLLIGEELFMQLHWNDTGGDRSFGTFGLNYAHIIAPFNASFTTSALYNEHNGTAYIEHKMFCDGILIFRSNLQIGKLMLRGRDQEECDTRYSVLGNRRFTIWRELNTSTRRCTQRSSSYQRKQEYTCRREGKQNEDKNKLFIGGKTCGIRGKVAGTVFNDHSRSQRQRRNRLALKFNLKTYLAICI